MSNISNRFFITALDDGTTLHGNLSVDGSLSQTWTGTAAIPNWGTDGSGNANQPTIMLTLISGGTYIGTVSGSANGYISQADWYYNNTQIVFQTTESTITVGGNTITGYRSSTTEAAGFNGTFFKYTADMVVDTTQNITVKVPALRITKNLASSNNVDLDTITLQGKYNSGSGILDFSASAQVRISLMSSGGYVGVITFANGISDITDQSQTITMTGTLYNSEGGTVSCKTRWLANGSQFQAKSTTNTASRTGTDVTDNEVIECEFYIAEDGQDTLVYTAYASIDDMQDNEYMYIQYNGANGNAASLRKGQTATFTIWVGKNTDPTPDASYVAYQYKLLRGDGTQLQDWTNLTPDSSHKCTLAITYDTVNAAGKNVTGIIRASTSSF